MAIKDLFYGRRDDFAAPMYNGQTPALDTDLPYVTRAVYVGGAGNLSVQMVGNGAPTDGAIVTLASVPAGTLLPLRIRQVRSSGTTATNIIAFW